MRTLLFLALLLIVCNDAHAKLNFSTIKDYAELSNGTYLNDEALGQILEEKQRQLVHQATFTNSQVSFYLSSNDDIQTIAIRGTANLENVMLNLNLALQTDTTLAISLHQGFASAARAVYQEVQPFLAPDMPISTTGHSLGGAIAVILAMYLEQDGYDLQQVITFGQPKVTNVSGAKKFIALPLLRVVTPEDIVPLVPPISPLQITNLDIFWHMGDEIILQGKNQYALTTGIKSMLRATKFGSSIPSEKNLIAHKMMTYLAKLNELQQESQEVTYKTDINVFGFTLD
ncbi:lipase family protein [Marinomonas sp.]